MSLAVERWTGDDAAVRAVATGDQSRCGAQSIPLL
jgi:hypothetical protein